jgi:hypothetical protein
MKGNKPPATYLVEPISREARKDLAELPNTTFLVVLCWE